MIAGARSGNLRQSEDDSRLDQHLTARLVTISNCSGAGSRTYAGEGLVGLAWAFLLAGAEQVIAALWEVDDDATAKLMDEMYAQIRRGHEWSDY
ncbi:MAG TPA: CHAT domain-containing protein [Thermoanaerobaculia bacterium]|nr:CHAT domain-containing protein [Thermoanaerobaculia bacterium]